MHLILNNIWTTSRVILLLVLQRDIAVFEPKNRVCDTDNGADVPRKCLSRAVVLVVRGKNRGIEIRYKLSFL